LVVAQQNSQTVAVLVIDCDGFSGGFMAARKRIQQDLGSDWPAEWIR